MWQGKTLQVVGNGFCTGTFTPCPFSQFNTSNSPKGLWRKSKSERKFLKMTSNLYNDDVESEI